MRPLEAPKLKKSAAKSEEPNRHRKVPGMVKRLRRSGILGRVIELGRMSDATIAQHGKSEGIYRDRAFREHQQRLFGAIDRLAGLRYAPSNRGTDKVAVVNTVRVTVSGDSWTLRIPAKVEQATQASALKATQGERK